MRGRAVRSRAHLNALPGQPKKATPLLPALHARADGAAIDAAFDAEAAVLAEWLVSKLSRNCGRRRPCHRAARRIQLGAAPLRGPAGAEL